MDRIAEALERARENGGPLAVIRPNRANRPQEAEREDAPGEIRYTHTRKVSVSPELLREHRIIGGVRSSGYKDAYKILCTQIVQRLRENGWNALAVTSPKGREGKTLTAINLAISLGQEVDQTVLLVDADLRTPRVHRYFGLPDGQGLSDVLIRDAALQDILVYPDMGRFVILPGGKPILNSSEMLGSQKMMGLVQELKTRYPSRIVVFDLPPVLSAADALAFSPYVDAALLVVEEGETERDDIQRAAEMLGATQLIGTVLNKSRQIEVQDEVRAPARSPGWLGRLLRRKE